MSVERVDYADVAPFARLAAKEGVSVKPDGGTVWFAVRSSSGRVLAFGGVWHGGGRLARLKGAWTAPGERGAGYGRALVDARLTHVESLPGVAVVEVLMASTRDVRFWEGLGFVAVGKRRNGATVLRRDRR